MPVGECERTFAAAAAHDGVVLARARVPWLNQRGHLGLPAEAEGVLDVLERIFVALGGNRDEQATKRLTALPGDFVHAPSGTFIEIDEHQHFTSHRLRTLELYPPDVALGFDLATYVDLCRQWSGRSDRYRMSKAARGFGEGGRQRQRAYHDALRDLVTPAIGLPPIIRAAAADGDGASAYAGVRGRVVRCLE
ncbi:hypothetical protein ASE38_16950 [Cellulomonas sp. Root930]|nr:hypothetical protein ASE38_16950 [Cellulomonas sp. Root930]